MAKKDNSPKIQFVCSECGWACSKWNGCCQNCGEWNTLQEITPMIHNAISLDSLADFSGKIRAISQIDTQNEIRYHTGSGELDRVLGGGLVKGSIVLLGGEPGIGKSTLLLQICQFLGENHIILYISGEESGRQIRLRAERLQVLSENLLVLIENNAQTVCDAIHAKKTDVV
ncbi:MAG: DNA repair protein RadA, partial [Oscillospiraceae bacterium]|nr:DNA repair protein RadA [Oscillospiraceae bacterium]